MTAKKIQGAVLGFIAAASYGLNPLFALPLMGAGMNTSSILWYRYILAIPIMALMVLARRKSFRVSGRQLLALGALGICFGVSSLALFESFRYMDSGIASTLLFIYPLLVALIMALFFHERLGWATLTGLLLATAGIFMLFKGEDGATLSVIGTVLVFVSSLTYAIYIVGINRPLVAGIPTVTATFYVLLFGMTVFLADLLLREPLSLPSGALQWGCVVALAVLPTAVSLFCTTKAITLIGSTPTAILGAMEPVTAIIVSVTVFGGQLTGRDIIGLVLILAAVTLVIAGSSLHSYLNRVRKLFPFAHRHPDSRK